MSDTATNGLLKVEDRGTIGVLAIYVSQAVGNVTPKEIKDILADKEGIVINLTQLKNICEDLKRRKLMSLVEKENHQTGQRETAYGVRDVKFTGAPELGQLKPILSTFIESDEAKKVKAVMEGKEEEGERKARGPVYCQYHAIKVKFTNVQHICGTNPETDADRAKREKEPGVTAANYLYRDFNDKDKIYFPPTWFKKWVANHLRYEDMGDSVARQIGVSKVSFKPAKALVQVAQGTAPMEGQGGTGLTKFEALQPGEVFEVIFNIPTKGFMTLHDFMNFLVHVSALPKTGIGGYHEKNGRIKAIDFEVIGDLYDEKVFDNFLKDQGDADLLRLNEKVKALKPKQ